MRPRAAYLARSVILIGDDDDFAVFLLDDQHIILRSDSLDGHRHAIHQRDLWYLTRLDVLLPVFYPPSFDLLARCDGVLECLFALLSLSAHTRMRVNRSWLVIR